MGCSSIKIKIIGWIEMLTLITTFLTILRIECFPMFLLFSPTPVAVLGFFTIRLKPWARRLNLYLSPLIVLTYSCGFMILFERISNILSLPIKLSQLHFLIFFVPVLIFHILFFIQSDVKKQFTQNK